MTCSVDAEAIGAKGIDFDTSSLDDRFAKFLEAADALDPMAAQRLQVLKGLFPKLLAFLRLMHIRFFTQKLSQRHSPRLDAPWPSGVLTFSKACVMTRSMGSGFVWGKLFLRRS